MPIEIEDMSYVYTKGTPFETEALKNISLKIDDGEFVGIMGHTGCGKSTLIQLITGLLEPSKGKILLDGRDINAKGYDRRELRRKVGIVFQYPEYQLFETTFERDVMFGLKRLGLSKAEIEERVKWALNMVDFDYLKIRDVCPSDFRAEKKDVLLLQGCWRLNPRFLFLTSRLPG